VFKEKLSMKLEKENGELTWAWGFMGAGREKSKRDYFNRYSAGGNCSRWELKASNISVISSKDWQENVCFECFTSCLKYGGRSLGCIEGENREGG
jgi:hypothetical protein